MWRHNKQTNSFENVFEGSFISFARLQYLHQESLIGLLFIAFIFCSFHKMSKLFSFQYFAWATLVQVCVFPGLVEPQAKLRQMGSQSLSWAPERPPPTAFPTLISHRPASKQLKFPFFFFSDHKAKFCLLGSLNVLHPWILPLTTVEERE